MTTIEHRSGDLLSDNSEALVNTVNTVGVMGKGVALQFRKAFPDNYRAYQRACRHNEVRPGSMFVFETGQMVGPRLLINFPTKEHWRGKARMEYIDAGLADLVHVLEQHRIRSVAIPPLGCGNGGLRWDEVRPRIEAALSPLKSVRVNLYGPGAPPPVRQQRSATKRPRMTRGRAALIVAFAAYRRDPTSALTLRAAQKLAYLLQDRTTLSDLTLLEGAASGAHAYLAADADATARVERLSGLIEGFENPLGLELLTTVHWAATSEGAATPEQATKVVAEWTPRKREVFGTREVAIAWERLESRGWLAPRTMAAAN